ncbi:PspC domain-containing protein [Shewanella surugensis]|uniref:PspC domain-containing protein n=1 Tax=Shewanella surugensis TaxID=212020 RepID=A0ABT0LG18_9GAMM|nr:PspC domain-containing protein [Shewanella surugensis]MCL1126420.1 PspC domain-containing protein [Shewanella surugensis]
MRSSSVNSSKSDHIICGVVARISDKFGWSRFWTRIISAILIIMNPVFGLLTYFVLAWLLSKYDE